MVVACIVEAMMLVALVVLSLTVVAVNLLVWRSILERERERSFFLNSDAI